MTEGKGRERERVGRLTTMAPRPASAQKRREVPRRWGLHSRHPCTTSRNKEETKGASLSFSSLPYKRWIEVLTVKVVSVVERVTRGKVGRVVQTVGGQACQDCCEQPLYIAKPISHDLCSRPRTMEKNEGQPHSPVRHTKRCGCRLQ